LGRGRVRENALTKSTKYETNTPKRVSGNTTEVLAKDETSPESLIQRKKKQSRAETDDWETGLPQ